MESSATQFIVYSCIYNSNTFVSQKENIKKEQKHWQYQKGNKPTLSAS